MQAKLQSCNNKICSRHDIVEILLMLTLNTNQSINQLTLSATHVNDIRNSIAYT